MMQIVCHYDSMLYLYYRTMGGVIVTLHGVIVTLCGVIVTLISVSACNDCNSVSLAMVCGHNDSKWCQSEPVGFT